MEALLSFVPEAPMWQRQVACEPDLNVICATEEKVSDWIATDMAEARVLSQMMVEGEAWALVMTSWSEPMWLPESSLELTESAGLAIVVAATEGFGNRAVVEWVPVPRDFDAEWLQVDVASEYVLFRRWNDTMQRAHGPVMRASAFDVIRRAPLERSVRPAQDRSAGHESPTTGPSKRALLVELPDKEAAPALLERFLKSAISAGGGAPAARLIPDKLAAMSVELPATLPTMPMVSGVSSDLGSDHPTTWMVAAVSPEAVNLSDAPAPSALESTIGTSRQANEAWAESGIRSSPQVEPTTVPGQTVAAFPGNIESDLAGDALEPGIVGRKPASMVSLSSQPASIRESISVAGQAAEDRIDSASRETPQRTRPARPAPDAALPRVSAGASAVDAPGSSVESDLGRPAVTSPVPGHAGASRDTAKPATIVQSSARSGVFGEPRPSAGHQSGLPAGSPAGSSEPGTQPARPPVSSTTGAAFMPVADEHGASPASAPPLRASPAASPSPMRASTSTSAASVSHRETHGADDTRRGHSRAGLDFGPDMFAGRVSAVGVSAGDAAGFPVGRTAPGTPRGPVSEPQAHRDHGAQETNGLPGEPAASRVSKVPFPSSLEANEPVARRAASHSSRQQPAPEPKPPTRATPAGPSEDLTLPASLDVPVQRLAAGVQNTAPALAQARRPADNRHTDHRPVVAQPASKDAAATEPLVRVRATAIAPPVIHIAPAAERRDHGRDALMPAKMRVIRNISVGRVVVEVGEPESSSRESSRKAKPGSLLALIPPSALRGFS
jgi:hypothetical protein